MSSRPDGHVPRLPRRRFLTGALRVTAAGLVAPRLAGVAGCTPEPDARIVRVDVASLAPGERLVVMDGEAPFELRWSAAGVAARSLLCTHQGCVVQWLEADRQYACPCHDARFDERGVPLYGPAQRPLRNLPVVRNGDEVQVDLRTTEA